MNTYQYASISETKKTDAINVTLVSQLKEYVDRTVIMHGSVYKIRKMKGFSFLILRTARFCIQCVCDDQALLNELQEEACVRMVAEVVREERARLGIELHVKQITVLSGPSAQMPIVINGKVMETSLENKLDYRPLTLRNEKERAIFKIQEGIVRGFRSYLQENGFTEIHSPKIVYAGAEGGANIFRLDYFGREAYLAQSPQFYKQMMVGVFERVYEVGPIFRAEKHDTSRHLNEYTGMDFEMGYIDSFRDVMEMETGMLKAAVTELEREYGPELELLGVRLPHIREIPSLKFSEAKALITERTGRIFRESHDFEPEEERLLSEIVERETGSEFVFVTHYPAEKRPFYVMEDPENPGETLSFDLIFRGLEITTGGQRIHDYGMQLQKLCDRGMDPEAFESFLMMHRHGMPPHGGLGLGLERFTARLLGFENVRQACLFPRDINRLTP
ncbi:MAG: aspartate--tRNA(Asn) ligase [Acetatifactor sp.]|nr:aspartate--tRNA(Asn) ligase [Acetatifactor sp.]